MNVKDASLDGSYISLQRIIRQQGLDFTTEEASVLIIKDRQEIRMVTLNLEKQQSQVLKITQCEEENAGWIFSHSLIVERYLNKIIITTTSTSKKSEGKDKERKIL
jgi:hypothetical protein